MPNRIFRRWAAALSAIALFAATLSAVAAADNDPDFSNTTIQTDPSLNVQTLSPAQSMSLQNALSCIGDNRNSLGPSCSADQMMSQMLSQPLIVAPPKQKGYPVCGGLDERGKLQPRCQSTPATYRKKASLSCDSKKGQFHGDGGNCLVCPDGFKRTVRDPDGERACRKGAFKNKQYAKAIVVGKVGCEAGQHFAIVRGGSCWTCPPFSERNRWAPPTNKNACLFKGPIWQSPVYPEPGLFRLKGGPELVLDILSQPAVVNAALDEMAKAEGIRDTAAFRAQNWAIIRTDPDLSPVVNALALMRVIATAGSPKATPYEKAFVNSVAEYIRDRRTFVAQDAIDAYENWLKADELRRETRTTKIQHLFDYGLAPIDFHRHALAQTKGAGLVGAVMFHTVLTNKGMLTLFMPTRYESVAVSADLAGKFFSIGRRIGQLRNKVKNIRTGTKTITRVLSAMGSSSTLTNVAFSAGPQILVGATLEILVRNVEIFVKIAAARPKLQNRLKAAKAPVNLAAMLSTEAGIDEFLSHWGMMTDPVQPARYTGPQRNAFAQAAKAGETAQPTAAAAAPPPAAAANASCQVCLFNDANYQGKSACVTGDVVNLNQVGLKNAVSSVRFTGDGCSRVSIRLFRFAGFRNEHVIIRSDTPFLGTLPLGRQNWNDRAASLKYDRQ